MSDWFSADSQDMQIWDVIYKTETITGNGIRLRVEWARAPETGMRGEGVSISYCLLFKKYPQSKQNLSYE